MQPNQSTSVVQIAQRAATDDAFKLLLLADPAAVLRAEGLDLPEAMRVVILQDTSEVCHLVLPPLADELSDAQLEAASGGLRPYMAKIDRFAT